jgi:acyl-CoA thioesterase
MLFSQILASMRADGAGYAAEITGDWLQGRAVFGGLAAALGNQAMRRLVPADRLLRGLEVTFVAPLVPGMVRIDTQVLRVGKSVNIAQARLFSADQLATTLTGIYGASRPAAISIEPQAPSGVPAADALQDATLPRGAPVFLQHFAARWAEGSRPFSGSKLQRSKVYLRHRDAAAAQTESGVIALIDCLPSPVLQMMTTAAQSSSLTWTLEFIRHDFAFAAEAWWRVDTEVGSARDGYSSQFSIVLDPAGAPVAFSRQLVAVFG